jgi:nucleotide-binding universal stress UspA family protein
VTGTIVVGVDGSPTSLKALRWAVELAGALGSRVVAVNAWGLPLTAAIPGAIDPAPTPPGEIYEDSARRVLAAAVGSLGEVGVEIEEEVVAGSAAHVLLDVSAGADLLVIGSRGHGGVAGLFLGSVSHSVVGKAKVPVAVIPHDDD